ncbi:MAG: amidohydrolase family protein [Hyphomicrobiales bacterium]|nr:amidohydrolase family protein [Hyphomicrobiales bacterium]
MDDAIGILRDGEILLQDDRIAAVGHALGAEADREIDARRMIVMPGLVNAHLHTFQAGFRGVGSEWLGADYFKNLYGDMSTRFTPEDNYLGNLLGALTQLSNGVTTLFDYCHNLQSLEQAERSADALEDAGIRAVFGLGRGGPPPGVREPHPPEERRHSRDTVAALRTGRFASDDARVTMALAMYGPHWGTWDVTVSNVRLAREFGLLASSHVTRPHAKAVVPDGYDRMAAEGLLGPDHNLVHCQHLAYDELKRLVDTGSSVTSTTMNELHDYPVYPAAGRVHAMGALPSLGIDVEAMVPGDMWREMQTALLFARNEALQAHAQRGAAPTRIPLRSGDALAWVTRGGARALRLEHRIGSLTPGKKADLIMLRMDDLNLFPVHNPVYAAVEQAHAGNVDTVIVDGVIRKQAGKLLFDAEVLRRRKAEVAESVRRLAREAGYALPAIPSSPPPRPQA